MVSFLRSLLFASVFSVFGARVITRVERWLGGRKAFSARLNMSHRAFMAQAFRPMQPTSKPVNPSSFPPSETKG